MTLRLAFMGTPDFALPTLAEILAAGHEVAAVYCQPPRPAGRGQKPQAAPVARFASGQGLNVRMPASLKSGEAAADFAALALDAAVVVAYGLILPPAILTAPRLGCFNVHASLLPRWRGAAPIQRAIMAGDRETGVTIMRMDEGLDTGPMLLAERMAIPPRATAGEMHDRLAALGASLMVRALAALERDSLAEVPQPASGVTLAPKITKAETRLDWSRPAAMLDRQVRGLSPHPGAWFSVHDTRIKVLAGEPVPGSGPPGTLLDDGLCVACGEGALRLLRVQRAGRAAVAADAFLKGFPLRAGERLD